MSKDVRHAYYWLRGERADIRYLKLGTGPLSVDIINNIELFTVRKKEMYYHLNQSGMSQNYK